MTPNLPGWELPRIFRIGLSHFFRGLAKGYCSFLLINVYPCGFAETTGKAIRESFHTLGVYRKSAECPTQTMRGSKKHRESFCVYISEWINSIIQNGG